MKTKMSLKALVAAAMLTVSATSSFAAVGYPSLTFVGGSADFGNTVSGSFYDGYVFDLGTASNVGVAATNVAISFGSSAFSGISNFAGYLNGNPLSFESSSFKYPGFTTLVSVLTGGSLLGPGLHTLTFSGTTNGSTASYGGSIMAAPVPEPETYAMLLAGLAVMGGIARRRMKTTV